MLPLLKEARAKGVADLPEGWYVLQEARSNPVFKLRDERHRNIGFIRISLDPDCDAWVVEGVVANQGWGPFLYDIAMEYAGAKGLLPDRLEVSHEAQSVWEYYFNRRPDVQKTPIPRPDDDCFRHNKSPFVEDPLDTLYKKRRVILPALKTRGLLTKTARAKGLLIRE